MTSKRETDRLRHTDRLARRAIFLSLAAITLSGCPGPEVPPQPNPTPPKAEPVKEAHREDDSRANDSLSGVRPPRWVIS